MTVLVKLLHFFILSTTLAGLWGLSHYPSGFFCVGFGAGWEMLLCPLPDLYPWVWSVSFIPVPMLLTAVGCRNEVVCVWERQIRRNERAQSSFLPSPGLADLIALKHFVQLGWCLTRNSDTLTGTCSLSLRGVMEKRKGKIGVCYLGCPPLPWNSSLRTVHHALCYFQVELK